MSRHLGCLQTLNSSFPAQKQRSTLNEVHSHTEPSTQSEKAPVGQGSPNFCIELVF